MALLIKDLIDIEKLAKGGMGDVYTATQVSFNRKVIIKKIASRLFSSQHQIDQFANRARLSASLGHDNIVQVYDFGQDKDGFYFVMEYIDGADLEKLFSWKPFPWQIGLLIAVEALKGLNFAHKKGFAHGDFKSNNILVSKTGQVKVADFGLLNPSSQALNQTKEDTRFITAAYMSPEVATRFEEIEVSRNEFLETARTTTKSMLIEENHELEGNVISRDIWSAGVLLYRIFCGQLPFSGETLSEVAQSIKNSREPIFFHFMPFLPDDCANAINACLTKEPQNRPSSLDHLIKFLEILISEIGFRDFNKEIRNYMVDKDSAINELEKVIIEYHSRKANECRQAGDAFKEAAHVTEIERLGHDAKGIIQEDSATPPDAPIQIQATNFFVKEKTESTRPLFLRPRALKITVAISVIIVAFLGFGISFTMLQKNSVSRDEEHTYMQKAASDMPQPSKGPAKSVIAVPDSAEPVRAPVEAPVPQPQKLLPKETRPTHASRGKTGGLPNIRNKTAVNPVTMPATEKSAILKVNLKPSTAIFSLDEKDVSLQEIINGKSVKAGPHIISASASGYESYQSTINLEPGVKQIMDISLTQTEKGDGLLHVYSYPWSDLYVDGVSQGTTPTAKPLSFPEGEHEIQLRRDGFKTYSKTINLAKGQVTHVKVDLEKLEPPAQ
jgi:Serine/threonine protein kinase